MAQQWETALRNAWLDLIESDVGASPRLKFFTGPQPANCAAADSGTLLADLTLPADWLDAASGGSKAILGGPWQDSSADNTGTAQHARLYTSGGTCKWQGSVTATGGGGDIEVASTSFVSGQAIQISAWTWTAPGA